MDRRGGDRRGRVRFEIVGELWGSIEARPTLFVRNLGLGGALVESPVALAPGSMHWLTADVGGEPQLLQVRVRHAVPDGRSPACVAGVEFVGLTPAMEAFLRQQIDGHDALERA
jgi:hypothetical protein